jgi:diaminohydroxyphosphoribosylaminopyrimidine deaminase/5-amino-6-(5-phosphoribosylamino)uracil reductase
MKLTAKQAMQLAMEEALKGGPFVSPNPPVGCVVLDREGVFLGKGFHAFFGGPHAEVNALQNIPPEKLKGATVFVTLEPCAHEGKTPSCARMLAKLPLKRVVYGLVDPNPLVAGQGDEILQEAGIETEVFSNTHPEFHADLEEICEAFLTNFRSSKVFVTLKIAQSLDGQIALKGGESKWITNELSREHAHYLRACYDAVLVGRGTVEKDNPSLDIRHPTIQKDNKVIVIDPTGSLLEEVSQMKITRTHATEDIFWCVGKKRGASANSKFAQILRIEENEAGFLDLKGLLKSLWENGLRSILIEGGAITASHFLQQGLVDRVFVFQAPVLIGAGGGRSWTEGLSLKAMKDRLQLENPKVRAFGQDLFITGKMKAFPGDFS